MQAESLIYDSQFRQTISSNAKDFIETNYSEAAEHEGFSKLANFMSKTCTSMKSVDNDEDDSGEHGIRVRFLIDEATGKPIDTIPAKNDPEASNGTEEISKNQSVKQSQNVEKQTSHAELENSANASESTSKNKRTIRFADEEANPDPSRTSADPDSTADKEKLQPTKSEGNDPKKSDAAEQRSTKLVTNPSPNAAAARKLSPRGAAAGLTKNDPRRRVTETATARSNSEKYSPPPEVTGKGEGLLLKNDQKQPAVATVSDSAKKTTTTTGTVKKVPLKGANNADRPLKKQLSGQLLTARAVSDSASNSKKTKK